MAISDWIPDYRQVKMAVSGVGFWRSSCCSPPRRRRARRGDNRYGELEVVPVELPEPVPEALVPLEPLEVIPDEPVVPVPVEPGNF